MGTAGGTSTAAFSGTIDVGVGAYYHNNSRTAAGIILDIKETDIAGNAVVKFSTESTHTNTYKLQLSASTVNVAGLSTDLPFGEAVAVASASGTNTLAITTAKGATHTANVALGSVNISKAGKGTQVFTGTTTFGGDVTVQDGTLAFGNAVTLNGSATVTGGTLALTAGGSVAALAGNGGSISAALPGETATSAQDLTITGAGSTYSGAVGPKVNIVMDSTTANAKQTFNGDLSGFDGNVTVTNGSLELANSGATPMGIGTLSVASTAGTTTIAGATNATTVNMANGQALTIAAGGSLAYNGFVYSVATGAASDGTITNGATEGLSTGKSDVVISGVTMTNVSAPKQLSAKLVDVNYIHDNSSTGDIVYNGNSYTGIEVKKGAVWMKYGATLAGDLVVAPTGEFHVGANAALTVDGGAVTIGSPENGAGKLLISNGGSIVLKNGSTLTDYTTLADGNGDTHAATLAVGGKEDNATGVYATISSSANSSNFSLSNSNITIAHAAVNVDTAAQNFESNAKLDDSVLTVTGGGSVKVAVNTATDASNDFVVSDGNATANLGSATEMNIGSLDVGADNSFTAESTGGTATANVTAEANLAAGSTVNANLVIKGGADTEHSATLKAAGATVSGNVTVEAKATLDATGETAMKVTGTLTLEDNAILSLDDIAVGMSVTIASATNGIDLGSVILNDVALSGASHVELNIEPAVVGRRLYGALESGAADLVATRVANKVEGMSGEGTYSLTTNMDDAYIAALAAGGVDSLYLTADADVMGNLMATASEDNPVLITLDGLQMDASIRTVYINGYASTLTDEPGVYAFVPEPATATLSLLALAALAARRRRRK